MKANLITSLPENVYNELLTIYESKAELHHAIRFIDNNRKRAKKENGISFSYVSTPKMYILKLFNSKYYKWLKPLLESGIVICNNYYYHFDKNSEKKGVALKYKLNINKFKTEEVFDFDTGLVKTTKQKTVAYQVKTTKLTEEEKEVSDFVKEDLKSLKIDYDKLEKVADDYISNFDPYNHLASEEDLPERFEITSISEFGNENKFWISKRKALKLSEDLGYDIYKDNDHYYIMDIELYSSMKKQSMIESYYDSILRLKKGYFYGKRNDTNNRLDTNLTNLPSFLCKEVMKQNNLVQLDLANAQFSILSNMLEKEVETSDIKLFKEVSYKGYLYETVQKELGLKERKQSKKTMFELMFSHHNNKTERKLKLKKVFPNVVNFVDSFKENRGYKNFSIALQKKESQIFIDGIWMELKKKGYFCLSKHDAIICKKSDVDYIHNFITKYFNKIGFKGKMVKE